MDIDEVRSWSFEKQMKWLIALGQIGARQKEAMEEKNSKPKKKGYVREGDKIVHYS